MISKSSSGSAAGGFRKIDQVRQQARALDVAQELDAQARARVRAFDEAGQVGHHEAAEIVQLDHAQIGFERGEGVIGDLGAGGGNARDQRGFSGVGKADQADISQQLQLEAQALFLAGASGLVLGGGLVGGRGAARVAASAAPAARGQEALPGFGEIEQARAGGIGVDHGPDRHQHVDRFAIGARAVAAFPVASAFGAMFRVKTELQQRVLMNGRYQENVAAASAIAARRAAARDVLLPPESHAAVAAVAGFHQDARLVEKQHVVGTEWMQSPRVGRRASCTGPRARPAPRKGILLDGVDADELAEPAAILELDHAGYLGEQRVVLAPADVEAGFELGAALPHDDRTAGNQLAAEHFHAQPLRVGIAPVLGTA